MDALKGKDTKMKRREFIGTAAGAAALAGAASKSVAAGGAFRESQRAASGPSLPVFGPPVHDGPPVKLEFVGDVADLKPGIELLAADLNYAVSSGGLTVDVRKTGLDVLRAAKTAARAEIQFRDKSHFFRGLGLLRRSLEGGTDFEIREEPQFKTVGAMFDVSEGNAVINADNVRKILRVMAVMGLNMIMLYTEDNYEVRGEPFFGYMRGKYSAQELGEIDRYAASFGIEAVPCIETLAHLSEVLQWSVYDDIKEDEDTLFVGEDKVYRLVEKMITAASSPFMTKRIHIGMDEAFKLGQGNILKKNGLRKKSDIMTEHLGRVLAITERLGLKPMIWSDMFFRAASKTGDYYDASSVFNPEDIRKMPKNVQLVYWDYYHDEPDFYEAWITRHRQFGSDPVFAGGIWGWQGYGMNLGKTFITTNSALASCKKLGIKEVLATIWGDVGTECNIYAHLLGLQLFAEHAFSRTLDEAKLAARFEFCAGAGYRDFWELNGLDAVPGVGPHSTANPSRWLMWQDLLMGLFDKNIEGLPLEKHYAELSRKLGAAAGRNGRLNFLFDYYARVSAVLALKSEAGLKIRKAYLAKDAGALKEFADQVLPELARRVSSLRDCHRSLWMAINQPPGWEIMDLRYGALLARIDTATVRLGDFLAGRVSSIAELEQERLPWNGRSGINDLVVNSYDRIVSASRLAYSWKM